MHAGAQDLVGLLDARIGELGEGEVGLHGRPRSAAGVEAARIEDAARVEALLHARGKPCQAVCERLEHGYCGAHGVGRAHEGRLSAAPRKGRAHDGGTRIPA